MALSTPKRWGRLQCHSKSVLQAQATLTLVGIQCGALEVARLVRRRRLAAAANNHKARMSMLPSLSVEGAREGKHAMRNLCVSEPNCFSTKRCLGKNIYLKKNAILN